MNEFHIRRFSGIETKYSEVDQDRGTLRVARNVMLVPTGAMTIPPWQSVVFAWPGAAGTSLMVAVKNTLVSASAATGNVHFVLAGYSLNQFLCAVTFNGTACTCVGIWQVSSDGTPSNFGGLVPATITVLASGANKTGNAPWFGTWVGDRLFLGNGVDVNLVWQGGALYELGPQTTPSDVDDPSQERFPPCTSFITDENGRIYAAGNRTTNALRVWVSEPPTARHPSISGVRSLSWSFRDIIAPPGSQITALSFAAGRVLVHLGSNGCVLVDAYNSETNSAGWSAAQYPATAGAGAPNPNCVRDLKQCPFFLGADCEIYDARTIGIASGYDSKQDRRQQLTANRATRKWNAAAATDLLDSPVLDASAIYQSQHFIIYDEKVGRLWIFVRNLVYCYEQDSFAVTGPLYLGATIETGVLGLKFSDLWMFCVTTNGEMRRCNLSWMGADTALPTYSTGQALPAYFTELNDHPGDPTDVSSFVSVTSDGQKFMEVSLNYGRYSYARWSTPWATTTTDSGWWSGADSITPKVYQSSRLAILEINTEDMGLPAMVKEFVQVRLQLRRNSLAFFGVYAEGDGLRVGKWRGTRYPRTEQICPLGISARNIKIRIFIAYYLGGPFLLDGITLDWLPGAAS
jgi:hypothetical protein